MYEDTTRKRILELADRVEQISTGGFLGGATLPGGRRSLLSLCLFWPNDGHKIPPDKEALWEVGATLTWSPWRACINSHDDHDASSVGIEV